MENKKAILISIKKEWWDKIKTGQKKIELRKTAPKKLEGTCTCYVYVPEEKAACGQFVLQGVAPVQPGEILEQNSCVSVEQQKEYRGDGTLYGWLIKMPVEYECKFDLHKLLGVKRPPQSWQYCRQICDSVFQVGASNRMLALTFSEKTEKSLYKIKKLWYYIFTLLLNSK